MAKKTKEQQPPPDGKPDQEPVGHEATAEDLAEYRSGRDNRLKVHYRTVAEVREIPLDEIVVEGRYRREFGDLSDLAASIHRHGVLQLPLVRKKDKRLLFGERRLLACELLGMEKIPVRLIEGAEGILEALQIEMDENHLQKPFTPSERVALARAIEAELGVKEKGKRSDQEDGEKKGKRDRRQTKRQQAEKAAGFESKGEAYRAAKVVDHGEPELVEAMDSGLATVSDAAKVADQPAEVQKKAVQDVKDGKAKTLTQAALGQKNSQPVYRDQRGRELPAHLVEAFESRTEIAGAIQKIGKLVSQVTGWAVRPFGAKVRVHQFGIDLQNAQDILKYAMPFVVCPACGGGPKRHGDRCQICEATGYLVESEYGRLPPELKEECDSHPRDEGGGTAGRPAA